MTLAGGDVQTITANPPPRPCSRGCHCGDYAYQDVYNVYPSAAGFTQADSINTFGAWDATDGKTLPEFNPIVKGRKGYGAWGMAVDSRGTLWVGGDYATSIRAGYVNQWSGGFMRFAARDATAPSTPSNLTSTNVDANSFRLYWGASTDNVSGAVTYEVIEGNKVIATTTTHLAGRHPADRQPALLRARRRRRRQPVGEHRRADRRRPRQPAAARGSGRDRAGAVHRPRSG